MNKFFILDLKKRLKLKRIFRNQFSFSHIDFMYTSTFLSSDKNAPNDIQMNDTSMTIKRGMH